MAQLLEELTGHADDLVDGLHHVHRDADGAGLVGDGAGDGLTDPPGGVGGELVALGVVKLLYGLDKAQVTLLDEVQELHATAHITLGDGDNQTQVSLGQALLGTLALLDGLIELSQDLGGDLLTGLLQLGQLLLGLCARAHGLGQLDLLVGGQQVYLTDLLEVHAHRVVGAEGVHHGVGIHHLLLADLLHGLQRGLGIVGQLGDVVLAYGINTQVLQDVIDLVHLLGLQIHVLQYVHQLGGGEVALLLAPLNELGQFLGAGDALHHLHHFYLTGLHFGLDLSAGGFFASLLLQDHDGAVLVGGNVFLLGTHGFSSIYAFFSKFFFCAASSSASSLWPLRLRPSPRMTAM